MLGLIGIKRNVDVSIREKLALSPKKQIEALNGLIRLFDEVMILSTCNRTEIYFNGDCSKEEVFEIMGWDINLDEYIFMITGEEAIKHLFELSCGFHSKIIGEDQILGQIRAAYEISLEKECIKSELMRLAEDAISCGKKFRNDTKLYEIPVSSASIAVNKMQQNGAEKVMVMGYGAVGRLVVKYLQGGAFKEINLVVRDSAKIDTIEDKRINIITYEEARKIINSMDGVISCTAATHLIVEKKHINEQGNKITLIDLAMPRDISEELRSYQRVELFDIDEISKLDDDNKKLRIRRMEENKYIIEEYINQYIDWLNLRGISMVIREFKAHGNNIIDDRVKSLKNKSKNNEDLRLAEKLIKSTSDYYVNRAIKVLKEERLKGREEECLKILKGIFMEC